MQGGGDFSDVVLSEVSEALADIPLPHRGGPVSTMGLPLAQARAAMVMVPGRGATAADILTLAPALDVEGFAFLAPQASGNTWYPNSFLAPISNNEPGMSGGLAAIGDLLEHIQSAGIPLERTMLLGFSQGACLSLEYAARNARRYGGIACLSGGLIGPDSTPRDYAGDFDGTPIFLGCSDIDGHIPAIRVTESASIMKRMGARTDVKLYAGMGHLVNDDEVTRVKTIMKEAAAGAT
jgi:predicted esterase